MKTSIRISLMALVAILLTGCSQSGKPVRGMVVEQATPSVGRDGKLAEAIGIETLGGVFTPLLLKGMDVPCGVSEIFSTASDNQDQIMVTLYRGNSEVVGDCSRIGRFKVIGIPPAPRGTPQIELRFAVEEGNVILAAMDLATRKDLEIQTIQESQPTHSRN